MLNTRLNTAAMALGFVAGAMALNGCMSTDPTPQAEVKPVSSATYGSGPGHTQPYPQSEPVNISNVQGVSPKYEPLSRGGNKYYYNVLGKCYEIWHGYDSYVETGTASWYGPGFHGKKTSNGEIYDQNGYSAAHKNLPLPSYLKVTNLGNSKSVVVRVNDRGPFHGSRIIDLSQGAATALDMTSAGTARVKIEYINVQNNSTKSEPTTPGTPTTCAASAGTVGTTPPHITGQTKPTAIASNTATNTVQDAPVYNHNAAASSYDTVVTPAATTAASTATSSVGTSSYIQVITSSSMDRANEIAGSLRSQTSLSVEVQNLNNSMYRVVAGPFDDTKTIEALNTIKNLGYEQSFIKRL